MPRPNLWTRILAASRGEVSASMLESYRSAGLVVVELMESVEALRRGAEAEGLTPWTMSSGQQALVVCTWNAFVLHSLGSAYLDADYEDVPATVGFVPPATAGQILEFFDPIEAWITCAHRAASDPNYRLASPVPAQLPLWIPSEGQIRTHFAATLRVVDRIGDQACVAVTALGETPPHEPRAAKQYHAIRGFLADAEAKSRYANDLFGREPTPAIRARAEPTIKAAIEIFHWVGQLAAMPDLTPIGEIAPLPDAFLGSDPSPPIESQPYNKPNSSSKRKGRKRRRGRR